MRYESLCGDSFEMELECSWLGRQGQGFVAGFRLFHTRIKGLTRIV